MNATMKPLLTLAIALCCLVGRAQTNVPVFISSNPLQSTTNLLAASGVSSNTIAGIAVVGKMLLDTTPYVTNGNVLLEGGALKMGSKYGGFLDIQFPVNTNSWQMTYGTAIGYISNRVYSATLNVTLGTQVSVPGATNLPFIGKYVQPLYAYAESGPGYNFASHQVIAQYFAGVKYIQPISMKFNLGVSYGIGGISDISQKLQEFGLIGTYAF